MISTEYTAMTRKVLCWGDRILTYQDLIIINGRLVVGFDPQHKTFLVIAVIFP